MKRNLILGFLLLNGLCFAQYSDFATWDNEKLLLDNNCIKRVILLTDQIYTEQLYVPEYKINFVSIDHKLPELDMNYNPPENSSMQTIRTGPNPDEFSFLLDDEIFNGKSNWEIVSIQAANDVMQGSGAKLLLRGRTGKIKNIELSITYLLYPDLPLIRKKLMFRNLGSEELKLEAVDVERFTIPWRETHNVVSANYGRQKRLGPYIGNWHDAVLASHDVFQGRGYILGNEAPGVMKRTTACLDGSTLTIGLTHPDQVYNFREWLAPGEQWESPWVFTALYHHTDDPFTAIETTVNDFVRKHMDIRLAQINEKPVFVYNTWNPFKGNINEKMITEIAKAASECGVEEFIIDAGWYKNATGWKDPNDNWFNECGDWLIDEEKFPDGFKPVFDNIKSLGMKPGLWISLGQASLNSRVYNEHPEYWTRHEDGSTMFLHMSDDRDNASACYSTEWPDYIKKVILKYVKEYGLEYAKLDLAVVTSPYTYDPERTGCYATDHKHKDRAESLLMNYRGLFNMFDEIHKEAPDLFMDCTFETMGELQLIDYAMCKHAEGNWLSNFEEPSPTGSLRIRQMSWWRSPAIPATSLVIGNPRMDDEDAILFLKSQAGSLPIMLGDPRKLSTEKRSEFKQHADWMRTMQNKHNYMMYRQDLQGFGEPADGHWDGFQRINTDTKSGGIIGIFRQGAVENERMVAVKYLDPVEMYSISQCPDGRVLMKLSGKKLAEEGFKVRLKNKYDGNLYEISLNN
jgi:alpha-galactosidase